MPSLKEIRGRIHSVSSIMQITGAMKMVSAAKLKRAQNAVVRVRPYADKIKQLLRRLCLVVGEDELQQYTVAPSSDKILLIVITSNRGLCGAFNASIVREIFRLESEVYPQKEIFLLTIGKKGKALLVKKYPLYMDRSDLFEDLRFENISDLKDDLIKECLRGAFSTVQLVYNRFKNVGLQEVTTEQFFPIIEEENKRSEDVQDCIFEPSKEIFFDHLVPKAFKVQLFRALLESCASEHSARMTAMHKATENASDLRSDLMLTYNKARQASITKEILEILSGAEALNG
ncbi:MAG: ATP synthase F1 subunit gamma [Flavobacteriales bacterium Tduv]